MGNKPSLVSDEKKSSVKHDLEEMYQQLLSPENIEKTIQEDYCQNLQFMISDNILKKYSEEFLKENAKNIMVGYSDPMVKEKKQLCNKLSEYYVKKINLVGTIINTVRLAHLKLDRIKNGRICYMNNGNSLKATNHKFTIAIEPTLPFKVKPNTSLILLDEDLLKIRQDTIKKIKKSDMEIDDKSLINRLAIVEIDNPQECKKNGGKWLNSRADAEKLFVVPSIELKKENKRWFSTLNELETSVYSKIGNFVSILDLLVEERVEPQMVNGKENRVKVYRDRLILDKDLDSHILKTKKQLIELFIDLDSYFIILTSMKAIGKKQIQEMEQIEKRLKELKSIGK